MRHGVIASSIQESRNVISACNLQKGKKNEKQIINHAYSLNLIG